MQHAEHQRWENQKSDLERAAERLLQVHAEEVALVPQDGDIERPFEVERRGRLWIPKATKVSRCRECKVAWPCDIVMIVSDWWTNQVMGRVRDFDDDDRPF